MSMVSRLIFVRGIPHIPTVREVNARRGPGTGHDVVARVLVGTELREIYEVHADDQHNALNGKVYQWFKVGLPGGLIGWMRDDLVELQGDFTAFGYASYAQRVFAFDLTRRPVTVPQTPPAPVQPVAPAPVSPVQPVPSRPVPDDMERVKRAAFAVTAAFEGHGYAAYQNYDSGIISYGRFQFTLAAGSLGTVITRYLERASSHVAFELRNYHPRIIARDQSLRHDNRLKELLLAAAQEPAMMEVQNQVATEGYWDRMMSISLQPRGIQTPLGIALVFDIAINFGVMNRLLSLAEEELGVQPRSRLGQNGITEEQFITQLADRRKRGHYAQAERDRLPGLKVRGDFWVERALAHDWGFLGNAEGNVIVNGRPVQVRNPSEF